MNLLEKMKENEIYSSVENTLTERFSSSMYWTFTIAWFLWNWRAIYTTIFVDQDLIFSNFKQLKIDYIWATYYNWGPLHDIGFLLLGPAASVIFALWVLSYAEFWCYSKACSNKNKQERERIKQSKTIEDVKKDFLKVKESNVLKENEIKKEMTEEEGWKEEFKEVSKKDIFRISIKNLRKCIYDNRWNIYSRNLGTIINSENLAYLHTKWIIEFAAWSNQSVIELTKKGKFFVEQDMQDVW